MRRNRLGLMVFAGVCFAAQSASLAQTLMPLEEYLGWSSPTHHISASDVTPDFRVIVGSIYPDFDEQDGFMYQPYMWSSQTGVVQLPLPPGAVAGYAWDVSDDGTIVTLGSWSPPRDQWGNRDSYICRWTQATGTVVLLDVNSMPYPIQTAGVSADGSTLIGSADASSQGGFVPFRWTSEQGLQFLRPLTGDSLSMAQVVSSDGQIIAGYHDSGLFRWSPADGFEQLAPMQGWPNPDFPLIMYHEMMMSADGQTIYGNFVGVLPEHPDVAYVNFRWTRETGTQSIHLQPLTPQTPARIKGFTPDQRWLFGMSGHFPSLYYESHACMWHPDGSAIDLDAYFAALGQFPAWDLVSVNFMSSDQRTIIGVGGLDGPTNGFIWIATLPDSFPCDSIDFNNDTSLFDPQDIEAFLSVYSEGPCVPASASCGDIDFNNDTSLFDPCDIDSFLTMYSEGPCTPCGQ